MSKKHGMAAINLEMTDRVPRVEYSAETHWDLVKAVTGIDVNSQSGIEVQQNATAAFKKAWNYDYEWDILMEMSINVQSKNPQNFLSPLQSFNRLS